MAGEQGLWGFPVTDFESHPCAPGGLGQGVFESRVWSLSRICDKFFMSPNPAELQCDTGVEVTACLLMPAARLPEGTCL